MSEIRVAKDGTGTFTTIQSGVNAAVSGDVVLVKAGTYNEYVTIIRSGITIAAVGAVTVTYPYSSMPTGSGIFWIKGADNTTIDGFKTVGGYSGIRIHDTQNTIIKNCYVENPYAGGIVSGWDVPDINLLVDGCTVNRNKITGIEYNEMISISNAQNSEIKNNHVIQNTMGEAIVCKWGSAFVKIHHNLVEKSAVGIYAGGAIGAHDIEIYNNIALDTFYNGKKGSGILLANERSIPQEQQGIPTNLNVHDNWSSGNAVGIGCSTYAVNDQPVFGTVIFRNNKACNNVWKNYLFDPALGFRVDNLIDENNIVPSPCTIPAWQPDNGDTPPPPPQPQPQADPIKRVFQIIGGTLILEELLK